jgi:hypothetical protein
MPQGFLNEVKIILLGDDQHQEQGNFEEVIL